MRVFALILVLAAWGQFSLYAQNNPDPNCPDAPLPRLIVGEQAIITAGASNNVRDAASRSGNRIGSIAGGEVITVLDGPECSDGFNWWKIEYAGGMGWTVEGTLDEYWIAPHETAASESTVIPEATVVVAPTAEPVRDFEPPIDVVNILTVGGQARVMYFLRRQMANSSSMAMGFCTASAVTEANA